ncbi:uncharacterized protein LOC131166542 [Malania oleifera]|uniref:uncharacterized protein LOC131166542 n=1 Tax=Malania oleifera TaxID=397392 RepID=UPI0025AEC4ED|nr:uncharacterized protein LOC131166542 [Malania oleifera]
MGVLTAATTTTVHDYRLTGTIPNHFSISDKKRVVAFTTPPNYAARLRSLLELRGWKPLWCPTVVVEPTPRTKASLRRHLSAQNPNSDDCIPLDDFSAVAFTSRTGIAAFSETLAELAAPPLGPIGEPLTIAALGRDAELLNEGLISSICENPERIRVLVPPTATPAALAESLGPGRGRRVLCPVPRVLHLEEPPVVPNFLRDLATRGWIPVRVDAYETRWAGRRCAERVAEGGDDGEGLDAVVFTSTAEVEGLLKSLRELGLDWQTVRGRFPGLVAAAHGPVTAAGAEKLGIGIDVVSPRFDSFSGVVDALAVRWQGFDSK